MFDKTVARGLLGIALAATAMSARADVFNMGGTQDPTTGTWTGSASLQFVTVGSPGNAPDPATGSVYGEVDYTYSMGKYDVTFGQYCQFLMTWRRQATHTACTTAEWREARPFNLSRAAIRATTATRSRAAIAKE